MLRGLAKAGANVVMHGLMPAEQAAQRCEELGSEFGVRVGHSAAGEALCKITVKATTHAAESKLLQM